MYFAMKISYWLVMPLAVLAGAFLSQVFIIFRIAPTPPSSGPPGQTTLWDSSQAFSSLPRITIGGRGAFCAPFQRQNLDRREHGRCLGTDVFRSISNPRVGSDSPTDCLGIRSYSLS